MNGEEMKLLGCPFCGCAPAVSSYETGNEDDVAWVVACDCKLAPEDQPYAERYLSAHGQTREEAVRHWNARAPVNRPSPEVGESALVERLRVMAGTGGRITCMAEYNGGAVASSQSIAAALCADAADEITNLQAELAEARKERDEAASARDGHYELSRHWNREYHRYRKARTQAEAQRDAALAVAEDVASDLRVLSNDMANDGVAEKWWRPVYDEAVKLEALASLSPAKDEDPTHD